MRPEERASLYSTAELWVGVGEATYLWIFSAGAGRPEATFMVERLVDLVAQKLKMDPADIRKKNFIPPFKDGHAVATGSVRAAVSRANGISNSTMTPPPGRSWSPNR